MTQTQAGPRRFHGDLPRTETGRHYVAAFDDDTDRWAAAVNLACAIEQQAAALERRKVVERITTFFDQYEVKERGFILIHGTAAQLARAILDALASESEPQR